MSGGRPNAWRRWVALCARRQDAASLAACRVVAGATVAYNLVEGWAHGVLPAIWVDARAGGVHPVAAAWLAPFGGATPRNVGVVMAVAVVAALCVAAGAFTRPATVVAWLAFDRLTRLNGTYSASPDRLLVNILFILIFSGAGRAFSVDARLRGKGGDAPAWPRYLLVGQLVVLYFASGLQKISAGWIPGGPADALWYILQQPTWQRFDMRWLARVYPLTQAATVCTWLFEIGAPLLLVAFLRRWRRFRLAWLGFGLALHAGIFALMEIGPFLGGVLALYAACLPPSTWRAVAARVTGGWWRSGSAGRRGATDRGGTDCSPDRAPARRPGR